MSLPQLPRPFPRLFQIGVKPIGIEAWIDVDAELPRYLEQKTRLFAERPRAVFVASPDSAAAQEEVLQLLSDHLVVRYPDTYRRESGGLRVTGWQAPASASEMVPLQAASLLVQEDLVLMRKEDSGWTIAAGAVCFPSSWRLTDKAGLPIHEVHAPVPGFGTGTRGAELIGRMFDSMRPGVWALRWNWSLYGDDALHHPQNPPSRRFGKDAATGPVVLRLERQTLTKLPMSGDILFTIRIYVDPIDALERDAHGREVAASIVEQLEMLDVEQLAYKGMTEERERVLQRLKWIAG